MKEGQYFNQSSSRQQSEKHQEKQGREKCVLVALNPTGEPETVGTDVPKCQVLINGWFRLGYTDVFHVHCLKNWLHHVPYLKLIKCLLKMCFFQGKWKAPNR